MGEVIPGASFQPDIYELDHCASAMAGSDRPRVRAEKAAAIIDLPVGGTKSGGVPIPVGGARTGSSSTQSAFSHGAENAVLIVTFLLWMAVRR